MNTTREVTPQWGKGNIKTFVLPSIEFDGARVKEFVEKYPDAAACIFNNQVHIMASGPQFVQRVKGLCPAKGKDEKLADWFDATRAQATVKAVDVAKTFVLDFPRFAEHFATEVFPKRGQGKDKRLTLENYDAVENTIKAKFTAWSADDRAKVAAKLKLDKSDTLDEMLKALAAKYRRPTAANVDLDELTA